MEETTRKNCIIHHAIKQHLYLLKNFLYYLASFVLKGDNTISEGESYQSLNCSVGLSLLLVARSKKGLLQLSLAHMLDAKIMGRYVTWEVERAGQKKLCRPKGSSCYCTMNLHKNPTVLCQTWRMHKSAYWWTLDK